MDNKTNVMYIDTYDNHGHIEAIVYYNGRRNLFQINNQISKSKIPLKSFLLSRNFSNYKIYLDNHGFGAAIENILIELNIKYEIIQIR